MKVGIHPKYQIVAFKDMTSGDIFLCGSSSKSTEQIEIDGEMYPLVKVEISRATHPYYTGKRKFVIAASRADNYNKKYAEFNQKKEEKRKKTDS